MRSIDVEKAAVTYKVKDRRKESWNDSAKKNQIYHNFSFRDASLTLTHIFTGKAACQLLTIMILRYVQDIYAFYLFRTL